MEVMIRTNKLKHFTEHKVYTDNYLPKLERVEKIRHCAGLRKKGKEGRVGYKTFQIDKVEWKWNVTDKTVAWKVETIKEKWRQNEENI